MTSKNGRRTLAAICLANLAYALSSSMLGPSLPAIITSLSLDAWKVGAIASAVAMGFFSVLPGGVMADRGGRKKLMLTGLFIEMSGCYLVGASKSFEPLLLSLVLFGIGAGFWEVAVSAIISDTFADNPSGPMNVLHSMWGVGGFLGPLLVGMIISASRDWHPSFLMAAALLAAAQMAILLLKEGGRQASGDPRILGAVSEVPKGAAVALALEWGVESGLYMYLPLLLESERGFGTLDASAALGILLLTIAAGRIVWSRLTGRMGMANAIRISGTMAGLSILAAAVMAGPFTFPLLLSTGFFISSLAPTILAYIGDRTASSGTGTAIGLTLSAASIGGAVIPASSALIAGWAKLSVAFIFLGVLLMPIFFLVKGASVTGGRGRQRDVEAEGDSPPTIHGGGRCDLDSVLIEIRDSLISLDIEATKLACGRALRAGMDPLKVLDEALAPALNEVGRRFEAGEYFLAELIMAGEIMKESMKLLEPTMASGRRDVRGRVVIGTVSGDLHSIGKDIVATLLRANGLEVLDLGVDVRTEEFVEEVRTKRPDILAMSALLTSSMPEMGRTIKALEEANLRSGLKVIIGGSPVSPEFAREIGADMASRDAVEGVNICLEWIRRKHDEGHK